MKTFRSLLALVVACFLSSVFAQAQQSEMLLVTNAPAIGTFYCLQRPYAAPLPFDPFFGALPIYYWNGSYYIDDSSVNSGSEQSLQSFGGEVMMRASNAPRLAHFHSARNFST